MKNFPLVFLSFLLLYSCKKEASPAPAPEPEPIVSDTAKTGIIRIEFVHMADSEPFNYNKYFLNAAGDSFKISRFQYYLSNFSFSNPVNGPFVEPESYHLLNAGSGTVVTIPSVRTGEYGSLASLIGVDSVRNCSGAQTGDLDVSKGMFWTWNSGYIFLKLEGSSPTSTTTGKGITYHVGGFKGIDKAQRPANIIFPQPLTVSAAKTTTLVLNINVSEFFRSPNLVDISKNSYQMSPGPGARSLADNYADMITFREIRY